MKTETTNMLRRPAVPLTKLVKPTAPAPPPKMQPKMQPMPKTAPAAKVPIVNLSNTGSSYVAVGITIFGQTGTSLLSANGQIVLFDTVAIAQQFVPLLGMGRSPVWSAGGEDLTFLPLQPNTISRAVILTGYDPYHLPCRDAVGYSERNGPAKRGKATSCGTTPFSTADNLSKPFTSV